MRQGFRYNRKKHTRELVLRPARGELFNPVQARWLQENEEPLLLPFSYDLRRGSLVKTLYYDVGGYVSLRRFVRCHSMDSRLLLGMVEDVSRVVNLCTAAGFPYFSVLFEPDYVLVNEMSRLRFAFVPLDRSSFEAEYSPLTVLRFLCDMRVVKPKDPNDVVLCNRLDEYIMSERGIFSHNRLQAFLRSVMGEGYGPPNNSKRNEERLPEQAHVLWSHSSGAEFVLRDLSRGTSYRLSKNTRVLMGRERGCAVHMKDRSHISRKHAALVVRGEDVALFDLGSTNGTFVNGSRLVPFEETRIGIGQPFELCDEPFCVDKTG